MRGLVRFNAIRRWRRVVRFEGVVGLLGEPERRGATASFDQPRLTAHSGESER
jgi:hypothetical protein